MIFTEDGAEKICLISPDGQLIELRINLSLSSVPEEIRRPAAEEGEIMNCISITSTEELSYELIVRDTTLTRFKILYDQSGKALKKKKL